MTKERASRPAGVEALDTRDLDDGIALTMLREISLTNTLFGGHAAVKYGLKKLLTEVHPNTGVTILDVGAGSGDVSLTACRFLGDRSNRPIALDHHRASARMCSTAGITPIVGDLRQLPVRAVSIDIAIVSMVLHHLPRPEAVALLAQLNAAVKIGVVVTDLRRSALAATGFNLVARMLRLNDVTRRDGVLSIRRGYTASELAEIVAEAGVTDASVRHRPGWRLVAYWRTSNEDG